MAELLRQADTPGSDRGVTAGSLYGATDSASSSARAEGGGTDLDGEGRDLEAGLADGVGAAAVAAATGIEDGAEGGKKVKKGKKEKKPKKPQMKDDIKTSMASERTFFKWIWTGFHIGGVGTFILGFFSSEEGPWRLSLVAFAWLVAFGGIFYGLKQFYRRRNALREGLLEPENWENPHAPAIVVAMFTVVIAAVLVFAVATA